MLWYIDGVKSISVDIYIARTKGLDTVLEQNDSVLQTDKKVSSGSFIPIDIKKIHIYIVLK